MIYVLAAMFSLLMGQLIMTYCFGTYSPFFVIMIVYGIGTIIGLLFLLSSASLRARVHKMHETFKPIFWLLIVMALNAFAFFYALYLIGISGVSTLSNIATVSIILGGLYWYGEKLNAAKVILIILTLISAILFSFSATIFEADRLGLALTAFAGLSWALIHFMMKNIGTDLGGLPFSIVRAAFLFVFFGAIYLVMPADISGVSITHLSSVSTVDWAWFSLAAFSMTILTYAFMPLSMRYADLSTIAIVNAARPMLAFFVGISLFDEPIDDFKLIAAILGLSGGLMYSVYILYEVRLKKKAASLIQ